MTLGEAEVFLQKIIDHYGDAAQCVVAIEEMAELQKEICKAYRGQVSEQKLLEEIADVQIMLYQTAMIFHLDTEQMPDLMEAKLKRTIERMQDDKTD